MATGRYNSTAPTVVAGENVELQTDSSGNLKTVSSGATPAGTNHIGQVGSPVAIVSVVPTLDTNIYASGDVLFDTTAVAGAVRATGGCAVLQSITLADKDDQKPALNLVFLRSNVSLGTFNVAPAISDANSLEVLGIVPIASGDYVDLGGASVASLRNVGLTVDTATTTIYVAAFLTAGTPTHTASGIQLKLAFLQA